MDYIPEGLRARDAREQVLTKCLVEKSRLLHKIYLGALKVLRQSDNPDRFALAANGFRELMEKVFQEVQVETPALHEDLKPRVVSLKQEWDKLGLRSVDYYNEKGLSNTHHLTIFLKAAEEFFFWFEAHFPRIRKQVGDGIVRLDGMRQRLPPALHDSSVEMWLELRSYFNKILHHNATTDDSKFIRQVEMLESFLLNSFYPRTFADADEIDALLEENR